MALTPEQRQSIYDAIVLGDLDEYASNPDSLIEEMTPEQIKQGLTCGTLKLEQLNFLLLRGLLATQKAEAESKAYTDAQIGARANFCQILASDSGQLLQYRNQPDGSCKIFYGIEPPANLANQYVDPVNGQDSNVGTRASPLRTIKYAMERLPQGTRGRIHLHEDATHYLKSSERTLLDKTLYFSTYGPDTDVAQATWDADLSGWEWFGWQNSPKARIEFIADGLIGGSEPGKHKAQCLEILPGYSITFMGILFVTAADVNMTTQPYWRSAMSGNGDITLIDCAINADTLPMWGTSPDQQPRVVLDIVDVTGASPLFVLGSGGKMTVAAYERPIGSVNPQGLLYNNGLPIADYTAKVSARSAAVPISPNFDANF
jgi:hypothetical protein